MEKTFKFLLELFFLVTIQYVIMWMADPWQLKALFGGLVGLVASIFFNSASIKDAPLAVIKFGKPISLVLMVVGYLLLSGADNGFIFALVSSELFGWFFLLRILKFVSIRFS